MDLVYQFKMLDCAITRISFDVGTEFVNCAIQNRE